MTIEQSIYPTTESVKSDCKELQKLFDLEQTILLLENSHRITRWMVEQTSEDMNQERYLKLHDEILHDYTNKMIEMTKEMDEYMLPGQGIEITVYPITQLEVEQYLRKTYHYNQQVVEDENPYIRFRG